MNIDLRRKHRNRNDCHSYPSPACVPFPAFVADIMAFQATSSICTPRLSAELSSPRASHQPELEAQRRRRLLQCTASTWPQGWQLFWWISEVECLHLVAKRAEGHIQTLWMRYHCFFEGSAGNLSPFHLGLLLKLPKLWGKILWSGPL